MANTRTRVLRSLVLGATLGLADAALSGQNGSHVLPAGYRTVEGNGETALPFNSGGNAQMRVMYAYGRSVAGFDRPVVITHLRFRPNGGPTSPPANLGYSFRLSMSTSRNPARTLSPTFDDNHGADRTAVFDTGNGSHTFAVGGALNSTPNGFVLEIPILPFEWDPRSGPLLLDFEYFGTWQAYGTNFDAATTTGEDVGRIAHIGTSGANVATYLGGATQNLGLIVQLLTRATTTPIGSANNASLYPWGATNPMRVQFAYGSDEILFAGRHRIHMLRWRVAPGYTFAGATYDLSINLNTMPWPASTMQSHFNLNWGADRTLVFNGVHNAPAGNIIEIPLQTPFEYDPHNGPLVVDIALRNSPSHPGVAPRFECTFNTENAWRVYHDTDPYAAAANAPRQQLGLVMDMFHERACTIPQISDVQFGTHSVYPFNHATPHRVMQLYKESTFYGGAYLGGAGLPLFIQHLRWRPFDFQNGASFGPVTYTCTIDLAMRDTTAGPLSPVFDSNGLINKQRVFDGTFSVPYVQHTTDPDNFPIAVKLDTPYFFHPYHGFLGVQGIYDLVVDIRMLAISGTTASCDGQRNTVEVWRQVNYSDPNATVANYPAGPGPDHFALAMRVTGSDPNATSVSYGSGCGGTAGTPRCVTTNLPVLPSPAFTVKMLDGLPNSFAFLLLGMSPQSFPLPGMPGCLQLNGNELGALGVPTDSQGVATLQFALPSAPNLSGFPFRTQWALLDIGANAAGAVVSDGQLHTTRYR